jgi:hypothetical protein
MCVQVDKLGNYPAWEIVDKGREVIDAVLSSKKKKKRDYMISLVSLRIWMYSILEKTFF